ncbi:DUF6465 family protein [Mediterraneibacter agrestimuris]|uniref:DUF6465 family protein n=1 Tax=Mediterraneibacter agrestimuris TaxID=2941333 RepID=UPI00203FFD90|nr:DUF6465 family protein [Mediterraneibacter agrestimuris]
MATKRVAKKAAAKVTATKNVKTAEVKTAEIKPEKVEIKKEVKETPKAIETKKDTTKAIETKAAVLVEETAAKKEEKTTAKKIAAKKPAAKKTTTKKAEVKTEMFLQFDGKEYTESEIFQKVKEVWTKVLKNKVGDMKTVQIYLKPEESAAYYVVNGDTTGKVDL